jgi:hypothetical protein
VLPPSSDGNLDTAARTSFYLSRFRGRAATECRLKLYQHNRNGHLLRREDVNALTTEQATPFRGSTYRMTGRRKEGEKCSPVTHAMRPRHT